MAEKPLKSLKFHGLDDIYTIPTGGNIEIEFEGESTGTPSGIDADSLGGILAEDFATKSFVSTEIAKAKLDGSDQDVDLSGYATKEDLRSTAEQVGAAASESVNTAKAEVTSYVNEQVKKAAPRNLLYNSDFRNPVNQRGKTSWNNVGFTIDKWNLIHVGDSGVSLSDDGITFGVTNNLVLFVQQMPEDQRKQLIGKTVTLVVTISSGQVIVLSVVVPEFGIDLDPQKPGTPDGLLVDIYTHSTTRTLDIRILSGTILAPVTVQNIALYEGEYTIDTLPKYQPKGYEQELLICRQYDPTTGEYIGLKKFNQPRNLLDNSDFRNPVAQAGFDSWHGEVRYPIDRWYDRYGFGAFTKTDKGITVAYGTNHAYLNQKVENYERLSGKHLTLACCDYDGNIYIASGLWNTVDTFLMVQINADSEISFTREGYVQCVVTAGSIGLRWAALYEGEYTIDTLPEYQPKGYGAELMECQRYFQRISNPYLIGSVTVMDMVNFYCPLCTPLRLCGAIEEPTVTFEDYGWINVDGNSITPTGVWDYYKIGYHGLRITLTADGITDLVGSSVPAVLNMPIFTVSCDL